MEKLKQSAEKLQELMKKADAAPWRYEDKVSGDPFIYQETRDTRPEKGYKILFENTFPVARYKEDCLFVTEARNRMSEITSGILALAEMLRWRNASPDSCELPKDKEIVEGLISGLPCAVTRINDPKGGFYWLMCFDVLGKRKVNVSKWRPLPPEGRTPGALSIAALIKAEKQRADNVNSQER